MAKIEASKELQDTVFTAIEAARTTGKIRKGSNEVTKALEKGEAKLVVIAKDVTPPEVIMHLPMLCDEKGVACIQVTTKEELGAAAGLPVGTAAVAITQEGEAKQALKEIAAKLK